MPKTRRVSMRTASLSVLATAVGVSIYPAAASAQDNFYSRDKYEAVTDRRQPAFDPEPIRLGSALLTSSANVGAEYNDNIFATDAGEVSDTIFRIGAQGDLKTDWSRHELGANLSVQRREYLDTSDESHTNIRSAVRGRLDVTRDLSVDGRLFADDLNEPRTAISNATGLTEPISYTRQGGAAGLNYANDRFRWRNSVQLETLDYDDGEFSTPNPGGAPIIVPFDQDFRDADITTFQSRLSYAISPNVAVFGQVGARSREYDQTQVRTDPVTGLPRNVSRDGTGYTYQGGVNFELTSLVRGDIAVGYLDEKKDDPFFEDVSGVSVAADLEWFPSRLTTVTFNAGRSVVDLGLPQAPSGLQTRGGVRIDHELRRNVVLSASADTFNVDYEDIDREDDYVELGVAGTYKINKRIHASAYAEYRTLDLSGPDTFGASGYDQPVIGIAFRFFP